MIRLINVDLKLPLSTIAELEAVAKLAGVKPETVAKVLLAVFMRQVQNMEVTP